jgi:hypothetical protein
MARQVQPGPAGLRRAVPAGHRVPGVRQGRRRHRAGRRRSARGPWLLHRADGADQHPPRHAGRARGDLRAGPGRLAVHRPGRDRGRGQRQRLRPRGRAGIWTRDISKAHALAKKIRAGTVWINCYNVSTRRCRSAATSSPAGAARWAIRCWRPIPRSRPSPHSCEPVVARGAGLAGYPPSPSAASTPRLRYCSPRPPRSPSGPSDRGTRALNPLPSRGFSNLVDESSSVTPRPRRA